MADVEEFDVEMDVFCACVLLCDTVTELLTKCDVEGALPPPLTGVSDVDVETNDIDS